MTKFELVVSKLFLNGATLYNLHDNLPKSFGVDRDGYAYVNLGAGRGHRVRVFYHHAVFMLHHNRPIADGMLLDHKDRVRLNNHPDNLREVTPKENRHNSAQIAHSPDKYVLFEKDRNRWGAFVKVDGKKVRLGRFRTEEEALQARADALISYGLRTSPP